MEAISSSFDIIQCPPLLYVVAIIEHMFHLVKREFPGFGRLPKILDLTRPGSKLERKSKSGGITMKKLLSVLLAVLMLLTVAGCGASDHGADASVPATTEESESAPFQSSSDSSSYEEFLENISVEMEIDRTLAQAIVTISNNSPLTFDGDVHVRFKDSSNKSVGNDTIFVEELTAGNWSYARINISETANIEMTYTIRNYKFTEGYASGSGILDEAASAALSKDFEDGFGGAGNPEWATSWYHHVTKVEVFVSDSNRYATITVGSDAGSESIDRIGNTIFGNYSKDYELMRVLVVDEEGNTVFDRSK